MSDLQTSIDMSGAVICLNILIIQPHEGHFICMD